MRREAPPADAFGLLGLVLVISLASSLLIGAFPSLLAWLAFYQLAVVGVPVALFGWQRRADFSFAVSWPKPVEIAAALIVGAAVAIANMGLVLPLSPLTAPSNSAASIALAGSPLAMTIVVVAVIPSVVEELLFRGILFRSLVRRGVPLAVIVSALLFAGYHFNLSMLPPLFVVGVAVALLAHATSNVGVAMAAHFANNLTVIAHVRVFDDPPPMWIGAVAAVLAGSVLWLLLSRRQPLARKTVPD